MISERSPKNLGHSLWVLVDIVRPLLLLVALVVLILVRHFGLELAPRVDPTFAPPEACTQLGQARAIHGASAAQEHWPEPKSYKADKACFAAPH